MLLVKRCYIKKYRIINVKMDSKKLKNSNKICEK